MSKHVVLTGVTGLRNRGVEALVSVILRELRSLDGPPRITVLTASQAYDTVRAGSADVQFATNGFRRHPSRVDLLRQRAARRSMPRIDAAYAESIRLVSTADLVIATGGDVFSSDYGALDFHLEPLQAAQAAGVPVALLSHSIGPFKTRSEAASFAAVASSAASLSVRESLTRRYLTDELGLAEDQVLQAADPAFLLPVPDRRSTHSLLRGHGVDPERPFVVLCPSAGISRYAEGDAEAHTSAWCSIIEQSLATLCDQILLVPHVQETHPNNDDRILCTEIVRRLADESRLRLVGGDLTASEMKGIIAESGLVLSERFHAIVAGLSQGTPALPIAYSVKARGILLDFAGEALARQLLFELPEFMDTAASADRLAAIWADRPAIAAELARRQPAAERLSRKAFEAVTALLT